jgi:DNA-binding transcriptional regulator PaaX
MKYVDYSEVLAIFDLPTRPVPASALYQMLLGYDHYAEVRRAERLVRRLQEQKMISRTGKRRDAFVITATGMERRQRPDPQAAWQQPWDGAWRVLTFDLPESRRKDRKRLWQALRARKLGLLQKSVWIWPHDLQPILQQIMKVEGLPECFCGFKSNGLFLCTTTEVVLTAWPWKEIRRRHETYRQHCTAREDNLEAAASLAALAKLAQVERQAYAYAFTFDPLLPRVLWPAGYAGEAVEQRHRAFVRTLRRRYDVLAAEVCASS